MNFVTFSAIAPILAFWVYGLHLIADKVIEPTLTEAAIITASGLVAALMLLLVAIVKRRPCQIATP